MRHAAIAGLLIMVAAYAAAQQPAPRAPSVVEGAFEVATIKVNKSVSNRTNLDLQPGGRFTASNVALPMLIAVAYGEPYAPLPQNRMVMVRGFGGGAGYDSNDRFDIVAKADGELTREQLPAALRRLLADRFKVVVHHDTKELPIYHLMLARSD